MLNATTPDMYTHIPISLYNFQFLEQYAHIVTQGESS